jgi:hypothetical protein
MPFAEGTQPTLITGSAAGGESKAGEKAAEAGNTIEYLGFQKRACGAVTGDPSELGPRQLRRSAEQRQLSP